jgi:hypothetical protein
MSQSLWYIYCMSMKEDLLEVVAHWTHDINDYLADTSVPMENHKHDVMKKLVSLKVELAENLDSNY